MSADGYDFAAARKRLRGMLAEKSPDYPASPSRGEGAYRMRPECGRYFTRL